MICLCWNYEKHVSAGIKVIKENWVLSVHLAKNQVYPFSLSIFPGVLKNFPMLWMQIEYYSRENWIEKSESTKQRFK